MKAIIYTGAVLMIGAGIYGFVDYKKKAGEKDFKNLYQHETPAASTTIVPVAEKVQPLEELKVETPVPVKEVVRKKGSRKRDRVFSTKFFSRAALDEKAIERLKAIAADTTIKQ